MCGVFLTIDEREKEDENSSACHSAHWRMDSRLNRGYDDDFPDDHNSHEYFLHNESALERFWSGHSESKRVSQ